MSRSSPPYGFGDDDSTRRLLRTRPPRAALAWVGEVLGGTVVSARPLRGGESSAMHLLTVARAGDRADQAVLRRYVRPEMNAGEPGIAAREARVLRFAETVAIPTPRLLACDPAGSKAGVPAVLMSRVPGRVDWSPTDMDAWLARLAEPLLPLHATALPPPGVICPFTPYRQNSYETPAWVRWPGVWTRATEIYLESAPCGGANRCGGGDRCGGGGPDARGVFIHRDYHPGNVLWRRGRVTGVVDWQSASIGPAVVDVAHCRGNLRPYGADVAARFTAIWEQISGERYDPWGDIITIIGFLDGLRDDPPSERLVIEDALAAAVAELRG